MKKIIFCILLISLMGLIFFFSSQSAVESADTSDMVTDTIVLVLETISNHKFSFNEHQIINDYLSTPIRKCAHFTLYFLLALILYNLLKLYKIDNKKMFYLIILICALYACTDEIHQLFVPGRSGEIKDVILDTLGSILGLFLCTKFDKSKLKKINSKVY